MNREFGKNLLAVVLAVAALKAAFGVSAAERASADEAIAMVKRGVAYFKAIGKD